MRTGGRPPAGSFLYEGQELVTTWHSHDLHQIEYAFYGAVEVETAVSHCLLPPQQAAWIPAGVEHRTTIRTSVRTISVFFGPHLAPAPGDRVRILPVPPVLREMMIYSGRWPIGRSYSDDLADTYFTALGRLVSDLLVDEQPLSLPTSGDPFWLERWRGPASTSTPQPWRPRHAMSDCRSAHCVAASTRALVCRGAATWSRHGCFAPWPFSPKLVPPSFRSRPPLDLRTPVRSTGPSANGQAKPRRPSVPRECTRRSAGERRDAETFMANEVTDVTNPINEMRLAVEDDLAALRETVGAAYRKYLSRMDRPPGPMIQDLRPMIDTEGVWVVGRPINGLICLMADGDSLLVEIVAVHPDAQGIGLGGPLDGFRRNRGSANRCESPVALHERSHGRERVAIQPLGLSRVRSATSGRVQPHLHGETA